MKCTKCGATVLKGDQTCKKCGATLIEAAEIYSADKQYRSRFTLLFRAWMGATWGAHLKWLGYPEEAQQIRSQYRISLDIVFAPWKIIGPMVYQCAECTGVLFGKYREDADGHPVRYFSPYKK